MAESARRTAAVVGRVLRQLARDRRFMVVALVAPTLIVFFVRVLFDAAGSPAVTVTRFSVPFGAYIVHFATFILTAIVLVRERVAETLERMFVSGYRRVEIVAGYLGAYTTLATVITGVVLTELQLLFDLGYSTGRLLEIAVVMWVLAVISMSLGILVSNFARTEGQVIPFIPAIIVPSFLFSGIVVAVARLPVWAQVVSRLSPMYYANEILQGLIAGTGLGGDVTALVLLPAYGAAVLALATTTLREDR